MAQHNAIGIATWEWAPPPGLNGLAVIAERLVIQQLLPIRRSEQPLGVCGLPGHPLDRCLRVVSC